MPTGSDQGSGSTMVRKTVSTTAQSGDLKRKFAEVSSLYEAVFSEAQQLIFRRENHQHLAEVELVPEEKAHLGESHKRRLSDIVAKHCLTAIKATIAHKWAWPFKQPVDTETYKDYLKVVNHPMDLGTIKTRCETGFYKDPESFYKDTVLVFENARRYNPPGSDVYVMAGGVQEKFHERWAAVVGPKLRDEQEVAQKEETALKRQRIEAVAVHEAETMEAQCARLLSFLDELQTSIAEGRSMAASLCGLVPVAQQDKLCAALQRLGSQHMESVVSMVLTQQPTLAAAANQERELELSVGVCDALLLRQLQHLLAVCEQQQPAAAGGQAAVPGAAGEAGGEKAVTDARQQAMGLCWPGVLQGTGLKMRQRGSSRCSAADVCVVRAPAPRVSQPGSAAARPPLSRLMQTASAPDSPVVSRASVDPLAFDPMMLELQSPSSYPGPELGLGGPTSLPPQASASFMDSPGDPCDGHPDEIGSPGQVLDEPAMTGDDDHKPAGGDATVPGIQGGVSEGEAAPTVAEHPLAMDIHVEAPADADRQVDVPSQAAGTADVQDAGADEAYGADVA